MKKDTRPSGQYAGVGLVYKTLQILDLFQLETPRWSQTEITSATGLPKSTVNRLVRFLSDRGYLVATGKRNSYTLGAAAIDLGRRASAAFDFRSICQPLLASLAAECSETVILTSLVDSGNAVRCLDQLESTREGLRVFEQIGAVFPLHAGAAPKAVLAALPEADCENYLALPLSAITACTLTDPDRLRDDLCETRIRGYAVSFEETYEGVAGIGKAFVWNDGRPAGSLAIALPMHRATPDVVARYGQMLGCACEQISRVLSVKHKSIETPIMAAAT